MFAFVFCNKLNKTTTSDQIIGIIMRDIGYLDDIHKMVIVSYNVTVAVWRQTMTRLVGEELCLVATAKVRAKVRLRQDLALTGNI